MSEKDWDQYLEERRLPRAAFGFPWLTHRTVERVEIDRLAPSDQLLKLDAISRMRALTDEESQRMEKMIRATRRRA